MTKQRIVFTFGTLYVDEVIQALLGRIPQNFYADLPDYSIHRGGFSALPVKAKEFIMSKGYDPQQFSFLFLKPDKAALGPIEGRAYAINPSDELVLDAWEHYPDWYDKQSVTIRAHDGKEYEAIIYNGDFEGEKLQTYMRVVNSLDQVVVNAKVARAGVMAQFPDAFRS